MPLLDLWSSNPKIIAQFSIEQIVKAAGSGNLQDNSDCSEELRKYLLEVSTEQLGKYADFCLTSAFPNSGRALQDVVNELGRRLDFKVMNGRYQGTVNSVGNDGLWISPEGRSIVVEVKTTDAYRISLDTIAGYRKKLIKTAEISEVSSLLLVVGREDTGELEAQVRGSRHAWDMRLISVDALLKLAQLKEQAEDPQTGQKIRTLLIPREYTRLDEMVDVMFATAKDVESAAEAIALQSERSLDEEVGSDKSKGVWEFTDSDLLQSKREQIINSLATREGCPLIKKSRAVFWNPDHTVRAALTISKRYLRKGGPAYWYAYHPQWRDLLVEGQRGYVVLGCMDRNEAFVIPIAEFHPLLDTLNTTQKQDGNYYWHLHLYEDSSGALSLTLPKAHKSLALSPFKLPL